LIFHGAPGSGVQLHLDSRQPSGSAIGGNAFEPEPASVYSPRKGGVALAFEKEAQRLTSWDGTDLAWYEAGDRDAPPMVLCGGLGGGVLMWRPLVERFRDRFRLISFDYRGLYQSSRAPHDGAYDLIHHVRDLVHLLDHTGAEAPVLVGWSMGVQVGLELHRDHPDRIAALVALHGTARKPLETAFDSGRTEQVAPYIFGLMRAVGKGFGAVGPTLTRTPIVVSSFVSLAQRLGWMAPNIDLPAFRDVAEDWTRLDLDAYARIFEAISAHDASDLLATIETPTLVVAGGADRLTPPALSQEMAEAMPDARLELVEGATHFGMIECGDEILDAVERFVTSLTDASAERPRSGRGPL
jgi:pimeloyl-ACP methyl ester carboxylesterase